MHGAEMLVPYFIADRLREARHQGLVKLAVAAREEQAKKGTKALRSVKPWADGSWLPRLRGYPVDPDPVRPAR
jgi:hypothetical protein